MRIFVTGGNGFIGSVVVRHLIERGHDVVCLLRPGAATERIAGLTFATTPGDVRDASSVRAGMRGCDATLHLAAPGGWNADDPAMLDAVIVSGTRHVLEAARERRNHRVVFVSSSAAIDASETPCVFDERSPFTIADRALAYSHAKHRAEGEALAAHASGVDVVIVNPAEVYGPEDTALGTAANLIDFATSWPVLVCAGGTSVVHVEDVANGIVAALERGRAGERYILGGENMTVRGLAELVLTLRGRRAPIISIPRSVARSAAAMGRARHMPLPFNPHVVPYATRYWFVDNAKAQRELGVKFRDARATIAPTLEWLERAGHLPARTS